MDKPGELPLIDIASRLQAKGVAVKIDGEGMDDDGVLREEGLNLQAAVTF